MRKKRQRSFLLFLAAMFLFSMTFCMTAASADGYRNQMVMIDGYNYFYNSQGVLVKGFYTTSTGNLYYFDSLTGAAIPGLHEIDGNTYITDVRGLVLKKWVTYEDNLYYCGSDGIVKKGWYPESKAYYFGTDGVVRSGLQLIDGSYYYLSTYGRVAKEMWAASNGKMYYFGADGHMYTGWRVIDNKQYYFNAQGIMQTGFVRYGAYTFYMDENGIKRYGWTLVGDKYYCLNNRTGALRRNVLVGDRYVGPDGYWIPEHEEELYSIVGRSKATVSQMVELYNRHGAHYPSEALRRGGASTIETFCKYIYQEAKIEDIRAEVLFAQIMVETGWLQFGGDVSISQYNFGGLGATGGGVAGNSFASVRAGIRAQTQHLKAYATEEPLRRRCIDTRYTYVEKACAPYVEWLGTGENPNGKGWAASSGYGQKILSIINAL